MSLARRLAALVLLALSVLLVSPGPARAAPPVLTGHQQRVVLDLVDDACGDTWCEGDYRFDFRTFTCDRAHRSCALRLRLAPYAGGQPHWYWRTATVGGVTRFEQLVATSDTGVQTLDPHFYDLVNVEINRIEGTVPSAARPALT